MRSRRPAPPLGLRIPLTLALARARRQTTAGWLVVISTLGYDGEAVATQLHAMESKGVRTLLVNAGASSH